MASKPSGFWKRVVRFCCDKETVTSPRHKFHEVFQPKQGRYSELPPSKISEMLKSNNLDNAPTQSLLSVVNSILDESIERKNEDIPDRVACLLRKVLLEIERRISTQADHIRNQNNLFKAREEKYQSRIKVLETLASGTSEETQIVLNQLQLLKTEKTKIEERKKQEEQDLARLMKEKEESDFMVSKLKGEIEGRNKSHYQYRLQLEVKVKEATMELMKEKEDSDLMVAKLKAEIEAKNKSLEQYSLQLENKVKIATKELMKDKEDCDYMIAKLKEEVTKKDKLIEQHHLQLEIKVEEASLQLMKEKETSNTIITKHKEELGIKNITHEQNCILLENVIKEAKEELMREKESHSVIVGKLKKEIEAKNKLQEQFHTQFENKIKEAKEEIEQKKRELSEKNNGVEVLLAEARKREKEQKDILESRAYDWKNQKIVYHNFVVFQLKALQDLKLTSTSMKKEVVISFKGFTEDFSVLGKKFRELTGAAEAYYSVLAENRRLHNEVQELKGNIRVYCRIRPFLPGEIGKTTTVDYIGENGELLVINPSKQGKEGQRMYKFNKVFGPAASQEEVYLETRPLIRSALDGFNVCIFAYGQTGSGKTYTMNGPNSSSKENWGVNYRALNDLFHISQSRKSTYAYEIDVQMIEIYNEQVRDLLSNDVSQKRLGIRTGPQANGLTVPDASMYSVGSTSDVLELMQIGQINRAMSATALNERSSRSHSVLTIHVHGADLKTGASLRGSLHLVDLAGSERVDRSEVTGDRLKEAQHINKSLSALGDVISSLAQKSSHVPYRNSKLTQILQNSLGGHAKTLMLVQISPDVDSYSETTSTLKFAERVSGVELGAAKSNRDGKDVRELMEHVSFLKDTITRKDEEIDQLHMLKELKNNSFGHSVSSPSLIPLGMDSQQSQNLQKAKEFGDNLEMCTEYSGDTSDLYSDDKSSGADDYPEGDRPTESPRLKALSQPARSPKQRPKPIMLAQAKLRDTQKTLISSRTVTAGPRTVTAQSTVSSPKPAKRWN